MWRQIPKKKLPGARTAAAKRFWSGVFCFGAYGRRPKVSLHDIHSASPAFVRSTSKLIYPAPLPPPTACTGKSRPPSDARTQLFLEIVGAHQHHRSFPVPLEEGSQGCFGLAATATRTGVVCAAPSIASAPADGHVERLAPRSQIQAAVRCIWQKQSAPLQDHRDTALRPRLPGQGPRTFCLPYTPS